MRNRHHLYLNSTLSRRGPARLRLTREDNLAGGGATPGANADNAGGNVQGNQGNPGSATNNAGETFDPAAFWAGPAQEPKSAPSGESASPKAAESGAEGQGNFAEQITSQIESLSFGDVLTPEVTEQINNGDFSGFQKNFQAAMQQGVRQALAMQVQVLRPFAEQMLAEMRNEIDSRFTNRDDTDTLVKDFPAAKNPVMAETIRPIYEQALKNTKGDRAVAVRQTKEMMRFMAQAAGGDLGLEVSNIGEDRGSRQQSQTTNWLDTLTGR